MFFFIRMLLYFVFGACAGQGVGVFDETTGSFTVEVNDLATLLTGVGGYLGTFLSSRIAKARGWLT